MFDVAPSEANANNVKGNALLKIAMIMIPGKWDLNKSLYFFLNNKGMNTKPAINSLKVTNKIGPKSTAEILMNIKALPQMAASEVSKNQSLDSTKYISLINLMNFKLIESLWVDNLDINYLKKKPPEGGFKLSELDKSDRRIR